MTKKFSLIIALAMLLLVILPAQASPSLVKSTTIISVKQNESVVVRLENFPANTTYHVLMNYNGTKGIGGVLASKVTTNRGGTFLAKFPIPDELANEPIINIRFENAGGDNDPPYNWFYNSTGSFSTDTGEAAKPTPRVTYNNLDYGFPTFVVLQVNKGSSVTVETRFFPANSRWAVYIKDGAMANKTWYEVNGFNSASGGIMQMTLPIPSQLQYKEKLAIKFYCMDCEIKDFVTYDLVDNRDYP